METEKRLRLRPSASVSPSEYDAARGLTLGAQSRILPLEIEVHVLRYLDILALVALFLTSRDLSLCIIRFMRGFMHVLYEPPDYHSDPEIPFGIDLASQHCRVLHKFVIPERLWYDTDGQWISSCRQRFLRFNSLTLRYLDCIGLGKEEWELVFSCSQVQEMRLSHFVADSIHARITPTVFPSLRSASFERHLGQFAPCSNGVIAFLRQTFPLTRLSLTGMTATAIRCLHATHFQQLSFLETCVRASLLLSLGLLVSALPCLRVLRLQSTDQCSDKERQVLRDCTWSCLQLEQLVWLSLDNEYLEDFPRLKAPRLQYLEVRTVASIPPILPWLLNHKELVSVHVYSRSPPHFGPIAVDTFPDAIGHIVAALTDGQWPHMQRMSIDHPPSRLTLSETIESRDEMLSMHYRWELSRALKQRNIRPCPPVDNREYRVFLYHKTYL